MMIDDDWSYPGWHELPTLNHPQDIRLLWVGHFYDGPLAGMAVLCATGQEVWWECLVPEWWRHREYGVYEISEAERVELHRRSDLFVKCVGDHWQVEYDEAGLRSYRNLTGVLPREQHPNYYDLAKTWDKLQIADTREPFARFALCPWPHLRRARSVRWWKSQGVI